MIIVKNKIEETFNFMDKNEEKLNNLDNLLWEEIKFPMGKLLEESKSKI